MNPFLFKAHPLLARLINLILDPATASLNDTAALILTLLAINLFWTPALIWAAKKTDRLRLSPLQAYALTLPASLTYTPLMLTVVADVAAHGFRFQDRFFLVFALLVLSQILTGFYAFALRHRPSGYAAGLAVGATVSLFLLLLSLPISLLLLGLDRWVGIF